SHNVASSFRWPPRSSIENSQFIELGQILFSISLSSVSDKWSWTLHELGDFSVKSAREEIDKHVLVVSPSQNRWSKVLPIKLNVFSWSMMLDRLPTSDKWSWTLHELGDFSVKSAREEIDKHVLVVSPSQNRWSKVLPIKLNVFSWSMMLDRLPTSLWIKVIKSIHGNSGALDNPYSSQLKNSTWIGILKAINKLKVTRVYLMGFCKIVNGNGSTTIFWHDLWYGDICFNEKFKWLFNLELQKDAKVASKLQASNVASSFRWPPRSSIENSQFIELGQILSSISLSSVSDKWSCTLHELGDFSVKSAREKIDKHVLVVSPSQNRWSKVLPIKLNVFSWSMMLDRLPTSSMPIDLTRLIGRWWNNHIPIFDDPS
nr:hypothetical protein [Tanacetum cinerariifolium]